MWQRIQTIHLFLALVLTIICLCFPVATFHIVDEKWCGFLVMTNLMKTNFEGGLGMSVWPMFAVLLLTCPITIFAIFLYKKRMLQAWLCVINIVLILLWMALCAFYVYTYQTKDEVCHLDMAFSACLPTISLILYILARRAIIKDEKQVKTDRIC